MVPEMERKSDRPLVSQAMKEKINIPQNIGSEVVRDAAGDECKSKTSEANDVPAKVHMPASEAENPDINVTDGVNPVERGKGDVTEDSSGSSSSFGDTFSGDDNALAFSDDEINSDFCGSFQPSWAFPSYEEAFRMRKKKLTSHWRNYIRPIMWRCKWAELQMKKIQSQALIYSKILAEYDKAKQSQLENFSAESCSSRSLALTHPLKRDKTMQRKKRKRVEETTDTASYMQQHNLFAYFENQGTTTQNPNLISGYANLIPTVRNSGINLTENYYLLPSGDEDTSLEQILAKIDKIQSCVRGLTARVEKVISENPGKFSSLNKLSLLTPCESDASTAQHSTTPSSEEDKVLITSPRMVSPPVPQLREEGHTMSISPLTADRVLDQHPDIVETEDQPVVANKLDNAEDEIPTPSVKEDLIVYRRGRSSEKKGRMLSEKQQHSISSSVSSMQPRVGLAPEQNEKSGVLLASGHTSLQNNLIIQGKRTGARSVRKPSKNLSHPFSS